MKGLTSRDGGVVCGGHHRDTENDRRSLYAYEDALLPEHDPVRNKGARDYLS